MKRAILIVLDGWGIGPDPKRSAIAQANTPFWDALYMNHAHSTLITYGEDVGLPEGQMGNSEVGHMTIGAGSILPQELLRINQSIKSGDFFNIATLLEGLSYAKKMNKKIHLMGLLSDGGVHSHIAHLKALCDMCDQHECSRVYIHAFLDGRDTPPESGISYIRDIQQYIKGSTIALASMIGRYYAMDRDQRWDRIQKAYDLICNGVGLRTEQPVEALSNYYKKEITDEFIEPTVITQNGHEWGGRIEEGDVVIFFNFRTDRPRELTEVLTQEDRVSYGMHTIPLHYITMKNYSSTFKGINVIFKNRPYSLNIGEYLAKRGLSQLRIAETEKYAHVTYFFSGGQEKPYLGEERIMIPSPKVATYDLKPEMSAHEVTDSAIDFLRTKLPDFVVLNYANADMVGHTGNFSAAIKAVEAVDKNLKRLVESVQKLGYEICIIADHGNSDYMINDDGSAHTAHTMNPVPCVVISNRRIGQLKDGYLYDIAPTILSLMNLEIPEEMQGKSLIQ